MKMIGLLGALFITYSIIISSVNAQTNFSQSIDLSSLTPLTTADILPMKERAQQINAMLEDNSLIPFQS